MERKFWTLSTKVCRITSTKVTFFTNFILCVLGMKMFFSLNFYHQMIFVFGAPEKNRFLTEIETF